MLTTREVIAANVRARLAWHREPQELLRTELGWSQRTIQNKLGCVTPITGEEVARLAELFGLEDPGALYRVPDGFGAGVVRSRGQALVTSTYQQPCWSEPVFSGLKLALRVA